MKRISIAAAILAGLPAWAGAGEFSYSYLELTADVSRTRNTADNPVERGADGRLFGIAVSWEAHDSIYLKAAWSRESKDFSNVVLGTALNLDSTQTVTMLGAGYRFDAGARTDLYAEALAIPDFEVDHSIPLVVVTPSPGGPPVTSVGTQDSSIEGKGYGVALGVRHWIDENVELEGQISRIHTSAEVPRTGRKISDSETMLRLGGHWHVGEGFSTGAFLSFSRHTDDNFDNIRKFGLTLRYHL